MRAAIDQLAESERIIVIPHTHSDLDAIGSAVGLAETLDAEVDIAPPDTIGQKAELLIDQDQVVTEPDLEAYDLQVVVDAPSINRISPLDPTEDDTPLVVIDHHEPDDLQQYATAAYIETGAPATALLVSELLEEGCWGLPSEAAMALAAGTLDDTGFRAVVMPSAREATLDLLDQAGPASDHLADLWDTETPWHERMATAKAVVRATGYKAGQTILLVSKVGGEESAAVHALIEGNADIGVIISDHDDQIRVVARTATSFDGLSLPDDLLEPLATEFNGHGGGHSGAGVAKLSTGNSDAVEECIVTYIEDALGVQFGEIS